MRKLLLATVAVAALSFPAMAQNGQSNDLQNQQQMTPSSPSATSNGQQSGTTGSAVNGEQSESQPNQNGQQAQNTIDPQQLSSQQIKEIQQSLDKQGFKAGHADGKWGPETAEAVKQFQQKQNMQASGQLDQQTLQALGVNMTAQGQNGQSQGAATTGQGSSEDLSAPQPSATSGSGQNGSPSNQQNQQ